jgi:hypothetical protein
MLKRADEIKGGDWVHFPEVSGYRGFKDAYPYGEKGSKLICFNCPPCLLIAYPHKMVEVKARKELFDKAE